MAKLLDKAFTLEAIFECLMKGDVKGAKEVFKNYLWAVNKAKLARNAHVPRSTIVHCLEHENPTMDTFFKLMSA
jgi:DNA-binding phage protein